MDATADERGRVRRSDCPGFRSIPILAATLVLWLTAARRSPRVAALFALRTAGSAFLAEAVVVRLGLLVHRTGPRLAGVPLPALGGWIASTAGARWVAELAVGRSRLAPALAGVLAAAIDAVVEPRLVARGCWSYPPSLLSCPRRRGVPWWNAVGWFLLVTWGARRPADRDRDGRRGKG